MSQDARHLIEIRPAPGKGLGLFTKERIPQGIRVLAESPIISILSNRNQCSSVFRAFKNLTTLQQTEFLTLCCRTPESLKRKVETELKRDWQQIPEIHRDIISIWSANTYVYYMYLLASRINHSCLPNLYYRFNENLDMGTFHAVRDIEKDEELTISYINATNHMKHQRQDDLESWGIECQCLACVDTDRNRRGEENRAKLYDLEQVLTSAPSYKACLQVAEKMAVIQRDEGLWTRDLGICYHTAAYYSLKLGNRKSALKWAEEEMKYNIMCMGADHPDSEEVILIVGRLRAWAEGSTPFHPSIMAWCDKYGY
ncbi:SET domain-containing protein [Lindgomyces ingoldianus]|uniref:SET domain-containing protein n=1 Tax=Lindgomyces ingoldianus TaxID=673940 RepID=A0ACB6QSN8_9PLEO|nr:SET domain-containing protein [Lindgomyces ingoldianus]KAF2469916.1 SET domain-containing protein [Lindgomyces ingoldianus]